MKIVAKLQRANSRYLTNVIKLTYFLTQAIYLFINTECDSDADCSSLTTVPLYFSHSPQWKTTQGLIFILFLDYFLRFIFIFLFATVFNKKHIILRILME